MLQKICYFLFFKCMGWRMLGEKPSVAKYVLVAAPHTSNWDFLYGMLVIKSLDLKVRIFVKDAYYRWPIRSICDWLGLIPVNRNESTKFVDAIAEQFKHYSELGILVAPEGTRKYSKTLKSGYYYIAKKAEAWIVVAGPNFHERTFTLCPARRPLASFTEDAAQVVAFCRTQVGKKPNNTFQ